jgi:glucose-1-phosphate cytidylyltransferase
MEIKKNYRTAIILCGGKGTRLGNLGKKVPKTLLTVQGKPIIWYIIKSLKKNKFNHFILPLGFKGNKIKKYIKKNKYFNSNFEFINTGINTEIGKRIFKIKNKILSKSFIILNGDAIFKFNIKKIFDDHLKNNFDNTFISNEYVYPYGTIGFNNGKVIDFNRNLKYDSLKIRKSNQYLAFNYSGISIMKTELLRKYSFKYKNSKNFELSFYPFLIKNFKTNLIKLKGIWYSIDNIKDYNIINQKKISAVDYKQIRKLKFLLKKNEKN